MLLEERLDSFICNHIDVHGKVPKSIRISLNDFRNLNKVQSFRGIPLIIVDESKDVLDFTGDTRFKEDEEICKYD